MYHPIRRDKEEATILLSNPIFPVVGCYQVWVGIGFEAHRSFPRYLTRLISIQCDPNRVPSMLQPPAMSR